MRLFRVHGRECSAWHRGWSNPEVEGARGPLNGDRSPLPTPKPMASSTYFAAW